MRRIFWTAMTGLNLVTTIISVKRGMLDVFLMGLFATVCAYSMIVEED